MTKFRILSWLSLTAMVLAAGCASTPPPPEFMAADLNGDAIEEITLLSVVDHRVDTSKDVDLDKWVNNVAKKRLKKADYEYVIDTSPELIAAVTRDGLEDEDEEMLSAIGPENARWVLLMVLEDASSKMTFGSSGGAEMTGYLIDKQTQSIVWRNKEFGEFKQGGLIGMAMKGQMQRAAIEMAADQILRALPEKTDG